MLSGLQWRFVNCPHSYWLLPIGFTFFFVLLSAARHLSRAAQLIGCDLHFIRSAKNSSEPIMLHQCSNLKTIKLVTLLPSNSSSILSAAVCGEKLNSLVSHKIETNEQQMTDCQLRHEECPNEYIDFNVILALG